MNEISRFKHLMLKKKLKQNKATEPKNQNPVNSKPKFVLKRIDVSLKNIGTGRIPAEDLCRGLI